MKKLFSLFFIVLTCVLYAQAKSVQGLCVDNGRMYYFKDKVLYCQDVKTNAILVEYEPNKDTALIEGLVKRVIRMLQIKEKPAIDTARERIRNFYVLNLSAFQHKIYIGVSFKTVSKTYTNLNYAILELDEQLVSRNYYVLQRMKLFSMPPFHALQFRDSATVYLPAVNDHDKNMKIAYFEFRMDGKNHALFKIGKATRGFEFYQYNNVMHNRIMDPMIYSVIGSGLNSFYHHPFPILYDTMGRSFDPYHFKWKKDSIYMTRNREHTVVDYCYELWFYPSQKSYSNIILATAQFDHTIYMAVSNRDENKTDLVKYDVTTGGHSITTLDIPIMDTYFVFSDRTLYYLDFRTGKAVIGSVGL